eukprot:CCRYP_010772-RB/>CCRYP_010772-RB protein AED:0.28 eAED:0.28 QI:552/1/1/1/0.66/0.75/4/1007/1052
MSPLPPLDDAASSAASANENMGDPTSTHRQADEAPSRSTVEAAELPDQSSDAIGSDATLSPKRDELTKAAARGSTPQVTSQDAATTTQPPSPTATPQPSALPISIRPKSTHSPQHTVADLKQQGPSMSLPLGGSGSEDMMDLFSPPVSTRTRKNPRSMTVVTAADSVMRDSEEVILPFRGEGGPATQRESCQRGSITRTPRTETQEDNSPPNSSPGLHFDSSGEDFETALQLTFEESPESNRMRGSPLTDPPGGKDSAMPRQFQPPQQRQLSKQQKEERRISNPRQQPPQQQGGPPAPAANQLHPPYPYPVYYPHPYGGPQMMASSPTQMPHGYAFPVAGQHPMMPGVVPMPGYGFPPWGSPPGQYYGYAQPHMAVPPPHQQYPMHPPATPASLKTPKMKTTTPGTTPRTKTATPGKRKDRRYDSNLTVETEDLSFDDIATPMSPPSSKKKRDGSLGIGTWPSPPDHDMEDDMGTNITPQRGSSTISRSRREPHSDTPRLASFDENFSFGATPGREIFQAPSWSPGAMGAFFEEEGMLHGETGEPASLETWEMRTAFADVENTQSRRQYTSSAHIQHRFTSDSSPSQGGVTIRGSPISSKAVRSADRDDIRQDSTPTGRKSDNFEHSGQATWHTPSSSGGVRIRIGTGAVEKSGEKKNVDEINSVLRGSPVSTRGSAPSVAESFPHPTALQATAVNRNTAYTGILMPPASAILTTPSSTRRGVGKENTDNERTSNPCNCKKSKCLKLYCECFAAEKYCFGCKCSNCQNTPQYEGIREKAIADTKAKNPSAFQPRIAQSETEHATGCKCKKSACLKKYCECFEGGVVCGDNCKCSGCQNFIGSRSLMDRRRKMKDASERAEGTMVESTEKAWRGSMSDSKASRYGQSPIIHDPNRPIMRSPIHHPFLASQPSYQPHPVMMGQSPIVYPHGMMYPLPPYSAPRADAYSNARRSEHSAVQVPVYPHYPIHATPETSSVRRGFHPHPSKKHSSRKVEPRGAIFGPNVPTQTRTTALSIFSFLSNEDLFNASIVSKAWSNLAFDNELWQPASSEFRL